MGSALKMALATKTILFVGYSIRDRDFLELYNFVREALGPVLPQSYVLTIDDDSKERFEALGLQPLLTDATYFIELVKARLIGDRILLPDWTEAVEAFLAKALREHEQLSEIINYAKYPDMLYTSVYQDGVIHAFERMLARAKYGDYVTTEHIMGSIAAYERLRGARLREGRYIDVAYIDGFGNGLTLPLALLDGSARWFPFYYVFGSRDDLRTLSAYKRHRRAAATQHRAAYRKARRMVSRFAGDITKIVYHHRPFL